MTKISTVSSMHYGPDNNERKILLEISVASGLSWDELPPDITSNVTSSIADRGE